MKAGSGTRLEAINALAELDRLGWAYAPLSETEVRIKCPAHEDNTPSASLSVEKRQWKCHASQCSASGDIVSLIALATGVNRTTVLVDLATRYDIDAGRYLDPSMVEQYAAHLKESGPFLKALRDRGVTEEMMAEARLGYWDGRITIPVFDLAGRLVNVRRYLPGAPGHLKMHNTKGYGAPVIYRPRDLADHRRVWLCGGEMKALVVGHMMAARPELDAGAIAVTAGEGTWDHKWDALLRGKEIFVCMDVDHAGRKATRNLARSLVRAADKVRLVRLPLDAVKYAKGDVNDWVGREGATLDDLVKVMDSAELVRLEGDQPAVDSPARRIELVHACQPDNVRQRLELEGVVTAIETTPYLVPHAVRVSCTRDQPGCTLCPVHLQEPDPDGGFVEMQVPATSTAVLELMQSPKSAQRQALLDALQMPRCKVAEFHVASHHVCRDARLTPQLTMRSEGGNNVLQPAMIVGADVELNVPYLFGGVLHSHPKTHQATLVLDRATETQDSLTSFRPTSSELGSLTMFRPSEWTVESVSRRLDAVQEDLEHNVTRIFGRRLLHLIVDLTYHSVMSMVLGGRQTNGWINALIVGDSSQGKSETTMRMIEHFRVGERVECKNATIAGLLGGLQQIGSRWFVSWGVIPTHDRRLVVLEEVKGAPVEVIARLTDMRSSGVAEIPKIERRRAHARTRLIFVSNPRSSRPMSAFNFGIEAIHELVGGLEDVRRFDVATVLTAGRVAQATMKQAGRVGVPHVHTSDLCNRLIMWAWTLHQEDVLFDSGAEDATERSSDALCSRYTEALPLIDRGTTRAKVARLAAAAAARTFSTDASMERLLIRGCHVAYAELLLREAYDDPDMGYEEFSRATTRVNTVVDPVTVRRKLESTRHPRALIDRLLHQDVINGQDLQDLCELDRDNAQKILSFLVISHCLVRNDRYGYRKTSSFIELLRAARVDAPVGGQAQSDEPF